MSTHTAAGAATALGNNVLYLAKPGTGPVPAPGAAKSRMSPNKHEEFRILQRLIEEQRRVTQVRQAARQSLVEKILFHARRGMSRSGLEARWGREAVAEALDALSEQERERLRA